MITFDCDGVLLNWIHAFTTWLGRPYEPTDYNLAPQLNMSQEQFLAKMTEFNDSPEFGKLQPYAETVTTLLVLRRRGYRLNVISSSGNVEQRKANLHKVFGPIFDNITVLPLLASKTDALRAIGPTLYVEDAVHHAQEGVYCGHRVLLIDRPWNRDSHTIPRIPCISHIYDHL